MDITLDELIAELERLRSKMGGDVPVYVMDDGMERQVWPDERLGTVLL